jgi:hypothetical protein
MATAARSTTDADFTLDPDSVESDPTTWPEWTDADCWAPTDPGPDADDLAWAAREFNAAADELAALAMATGDANGLGLIPPDVAAAINATSIVGLADRILHSGSDARHCPCYQCVDARTARYAE